MIRRTGRAIGAFILFTSACGGKVAYEEPGADGEGGDPGPSSGPGDASVGGQGASGGMQAGAEGGGGAGATGSMGGAPGADGLIEVPFGQVADDAIIELDVPPNALGFTVSVQRPDGEMVGIQSIESPSGALLVQDNNIAGKEFELIGPGMATTAIPQSDHPDAMPLAAGTWKIGIDAGPSPEDVADVTVWMRETVDGEFHGGVIDVNLFIVPGSIAATDAEQYVAAALVDYAGLSVGTIASHTLDPSFSFIDEFNAAPALASANEAVTTPALNLFVVLGFTGGFSGAAGFSTGIPGNPLAHQSIQSGVFWQPFGDGTDLRIIRHELGHFAGLFHTTELDFVSFDPLQDTDTCTEDLFFEFACPDQSNVMFPVALFESGAFSSRQRTVLQASAIYRGSYGPGDGPALPKPNAMLDSMPGAAWAQGLSHELEHYLRGAICHEHADHVAFRPEAAPGSSAELLAIVDRTDVPVGAKRRALAALATHPHMESELVLRAADAQLDPRTRVAALLSLDSKAPDFVAATMSTWEHAAEPALRSAAHAWRAR